MIFDIHAHIAGFASGQEGNYLCPPSRMNFILRMLSKKIQFRIRSEPGNTPDEKLQHMIRRLLDGTQVDRVVMLALDGVYQPDGSLDLHSTQMIASNDFVARFAASHPKVLFGASIHPYRKDALEELDRVVANGACLIKWLPSAQNIAPDDPRCSAFFERMAHHKIPLLSHTGIEHTLARFSDSLNEPRRLVPALERGVTVIAAHCGTHMFLYERSWFKEWMKLAREYPNFYGDLSAFCLPLHGQPLRRILREPDLLRKVVYGSDFPTPTWPLWYGSRLGWCTAVDIRKISNPFENGYRMMKALGVPDEVFNRAGELLKLPAGGAQ